MRLHELEQTPHVFLLGNIAFERCEFTLGSVRYFCLQLQQVVEISAASDDLQTLVNQFQCYVFANPGRGTGYYGHFVEPLFHVGETTRAMSTAN